MNAYLVRAAGLDFHGDMCGSIHSIQHTYMRNGCLPGQWLGDTVFAFFHESVHDGMIGFADAAIAKEGEDVLKCRFAFGDDKASGGVAIESVHGTQFRIFALFLQPSFQTDFAYT